MKDFDQIVETEMDLKNVEIWSEDVEWKQLYSRTVSI
jgi:hypothetical protein